MLLTIAFSHRDIAQCERLLRWMQFLDRGAKLLRERWLLLVSSEIASKMPRLESVVETAVSTFKQAHLHTVRFDGPEPRYPVCANVMFQQSLKHVCEFYGDDMLWVEPDAFPTRASWIKEFEDEFQKCDKPFMGNLVTMSSKPHMTGNAVYGADWEDHAPSLMMANGEAWDTFCCGEVLKCFHKTALIQHVWRRKDLRVEMIDPKACLFHQDKTGILIRALDRRDFQGELFGPRSDIIDERYTMTRYYQTINSTIKRESGGFVFQFDSYDVVGGTRVGVLMLDSEAEQAAMDLLVSDPRNGICEITAEKYAQCLKKKSDPKGALGRSRAFDLSQPRRMPQSPAALASQSASQSRNPPLADPKPIAATAADAVRVDVIVPSQPPQQIEKRGRGRPRKNPQPTA